MANLRVTAGIREIPTHPLDLHSPRPGAQQACQAPAARLPSYRITRKPAADVLSAGRSFGMVRATPCGTGRADTVKEGTMATWAIVIPPNNGRGGRLLPPPG